MRIDAREVSAGYGRQIVLQDGSVSLRTGELVGLIGPNGSGKSTLLRVLSGVLTPRTGVVEYDGASVSSMSAREIARLVAFVPQTEPVLFDFSVREIVLMGRHARIQGLGGEREEDFEAAHRAMTAADVLHLADRPITSLSGGEHRRALLARALAQESAALLMDEPIAHLDPGHQIEILGVARRLVNAGGTLAVVALHDLNLAAAYCDRLILLDSGRIFRDDSTESMLTDAVLQPIFGRGITVATNPMTGKPLVLPDIQVD